jgi:phage-related protein
VGTGTAWPSTSTSQLERAIRKFIDAHNGEPKSFIWTKPADHILASIACFATSTNKIHATKLIHAFL